MLELNTEHPAFNLAMEVLVSISPGVRGTPVVLIREDFGWSSGSIVADAIRPIRRTYGMRIYKCANGVSAVFIDGPKRRKAMMAAQAYWIKVYGNDN